MLYVFSWASIIQEKPSMKHLLTENETDQHLIRNSEFHNLKTTLIVDLAWLIIMHVRMHVTE